MRRWGGHSPGRMMIAMPSTLQSERVYHGRLFQVDVLSWLDEAGRRVMREVVRHPGAVVVVGLLEGDRVIMIRNHRVAVEERLWELPAGKLELGEAPEAAAARELAEETGYRAARLMPLGSFYTSPGFADELMHAFTAEAVEAGPPRLEPGEDIEVATVKLAEAVEMIRRGEIRDGKTIAALLMHRDRAGNGPA